MPRPDPKFDIENLLETGAVTAEQADVVRTATERIATRDLNHRRAWMGHARDIYRVQQTIREGHFEGWLRACVPFGRTKAFDYARAAKLLVDQEKAGGPKFGLLPPMNSTVVCDLAQEGVDPDLRAYFLNRLIAEERVTVAEVRQALGKTKKDPEQPQTGEEEEQDAPTHQEPSAAVMTFAKSLPRSDRVFLLRLARSGELQALVSALEWIDAAPVGHGRGALAVEDADRLDEMVADALRETPKASLPQYEVPANDDDDEELPKKPTLQ